MTNKEEIFDLIQKHPEGLDDDRHRTAAASAATLQSACFR